MVYVLNIENEPLMLCKNAKARKLLKDKKAMIKYDPENKDLYTEQYNNIFKSKGDYERELTDLYYGATIYGWEEVELVNDLVIDLMIENGLAVNVVKKEE